MYTRPTDLPDSAVVEALGVGWNLVVDEIEYAPVGFGSHHWRVLAGGDRWFVTVDDLDARQREIGDSRDIAAARLNAALSTACALRADGLEFVVSPRPTRNGDVTHRVDGRYLAAVYEHIEGDTHTWGPYESRIDRLAVLDQLVALHNATSTASGRALADDFAIPSRDQLAAALAEDDAEWGPGPYAARAKQLLDQHASAVNTALARYDKLVTEVRLKPKRFVITHGEPHRANTINTSSGVVLIDWDTVLLAPPERDLWMLIEEESQIAADYTRRTGVAVEASGVEIYRLWWDLCEISLYTAQFKAAHVDSEDVRMAWAGLCEYLDPQRWQPKK